MKDRFGADIYQGTGKKTEWSTKPTPKDAYKIMSKEIPSYHAGDPINKEEYIICKRRGHEAGGTVLTTNPPWQICKYCKMAFRWSKPELVELYKVQEDA